MGKDEKSKPQQGEDKPSDLSEQPEDLASRGEESILPEEVLDKLPPEAKEVVRKSTSMFMAGSFAPPSYHISKKLTTDQIGKVIDNIESESVRDHKERMSSRRWNFAYLMLSLLFIVCISLIFLWKDKAEYVVPIITALLGGAGGYGLGLSRIHKKNV